MDGWMNQFWLLQIIITDFWETERESVPTNVAQIIDGGSA